MTQAVQIPLTSVALSGTDVGPWDTVWTYGASGDVAVWIKSPGVAAVRVETADLTVTGAEPLVSGGEVQIAADLVPDAGWADGAFAYIVRLTPTGQTAAVGAMGAVNLAVIEAVLDRLSRQTQDQGVEVRRSLKAPLGETLNDLPDAATRAGMVLTFDATTGQPVADQTYTDFVADVADALTTPAIVAAVEAAGAAEIAAIEAEGAAQVIAVEAAVGDAVADVETAAAAQIALVEDASRANLFGTVAAGLTDAVEGELFTVAQANGIGLDWYKDLSGVAHAQQKVSPGPGAEFWLQLLVLERSARVCPQYPWTPGVDIRWGDAAMHDGAVVPNRSELSKTPARTINAFTAGYLPNIGGSQTSPTHTSLYIDGQATDDAVNYTYANNQILYLLRAPPTITDVPDQTITEVFDYKRAAAAGSDQTFQCGLSTSLETMTATAAYQNKKKEIAWAGTGDIVLRTAANTADLDLTRVFLWPGAAATVPSWDNLHFVGGRRPFAFSGSLVVEDGAVVTATDAVGFIVYAPDYKTGGTYYDSPLIGHTFWMDDIDSAAANVIISTPEDDGHGTDDGQMQLALSNVAGFEGQIFPELWTNNTRGMVGFDYRFGNAVPVHLWHRTVEGLKTVLIDGVSALTVEEASSAFNASHWRLMSNTDGHGVEITTGNTPAWSCATLIDNVQTGGTVQQVERLIVSQREKLRLDPRITRRIGTQFHLSVVGDSNDEPGNNGEWLNIARKYDWLGAGYGAIPQSSFGNGGAGINNGTVSFRMQLDTGSIVTSTNPECGALATIRSALRIGKPHLTYLRGWTNNKADVSTDPDAVFALYEAVYDEILAEGDLSFLMIASPLAHKTEGTSPNFNGENDGETGGRFRIADLQIAYAAAHPNRVWFVDVTRTAYIGSTAEANLLGSSTTFLSDGKHLDPAKQGDIRMAAAHAPVFRDFSDYLASIGYP